MAKKKETLQVPVSDWLPLLLNQSNKAHISLHNSPGFWMSEGWSSVSAGQPEHIFYFVLNGSFRATIGKELYTVGKNDVTITPPDMGFNFRSEAGEPIELYRFRFSIETENGRRLALPHFSHIKRAEHCLYLFERIIHEAEYPSSVSMWKTRGLLLLLFSELFFTSKKDGHSTERTFLGSEIKKIRDYFYHNHTNWPQVVDLASTLQLSPGYFTKVFKRTFGVSPRKWMVQERIRLATVYLLESDKNITEISEAFGYSDVFFFSQQFKKVTRLSPSSYIKQNRAILVREQT